MNAVARSMGALFFSPERGTILMLCRRFIAQAEHLAEMHLQESLLDLAEREHSYISALDLDFDTIAAAAGFTKQALAMISKDPGASLCSLDVRALLTFLRRCAHGDRRRQPRRYALQTSPAPRQPSSQLKSHRQVSTPFLRARRDPDTRFAGNFFDDWTTSLPTRRLSAPRTHKALRRSPTTVLPSQPQPPRCVIIFLLPSLLADAVMSFPARVGHRALLLRSPYLEAAFPGHCGPRHRSRSRCYRVGEANAATTGRDQRAAGPAIAGYRDDSGCGDGSGAYAQAYVALFRLVRDAG